MAHSFRVLYRGQKGRIRKNFNSPAINLDSAVIVTAAEFTPEFGGLARPHKTLGRPHLGDANVYVTNIGPHGEGNEAGGVEFILHVDWGSPLDVIVTITVLENIEAFVQA